MSLKTFGLSKLQQTLLGLAFLPSIAEVELQACAYELRNKSRDMAPIDHGDLKRAIQAQRRGSGIRNAKGHFVSGSSTWVVYVNNDTNVTDPEKIDEGITKVGQYAWKVHEHMGWASRPNRSLMPSLDSIRAGAARGVEAGGKYMERASDLLMPQVNFRLEKVIKEYVNKLDI